MGGGERARQSTVRKRPCRINRNTGVTGNRAAELSRNPNKYRRGEQLAAQTPTERERLRQPRSAARSESSDFFALQTGHLTLWSRSENLRCSRPNVHRDHSNEVPGAKRDGSVATNTIAYGLTTSPRVRQPSTLVVRGDAAKLMAAQI